MVNYRRSQTPGASYFFTVNLFDRSQRYLTDHIDHLRSAFSSVEEDQPFETIAMVVLPDHLHMVMQLPQNNSDYPARWKAIKSRFTRALVKEGVPLSKNSKGEYNLWQRRYWEHQIRNEVDLQRHIDYIHFNPVRHGLVERVAEWPHSSFHRFAKNGVLPIDWGSRYIEDKEGAFGE